MLVSIFALLFFFLHWQVLAAPQRQRPSNSPGRIPSPVTPFNSTRVPFATGFGSSQCNVSAIAVAAGTLPVQNAPTSFIALGVGTQNYTCKAGNFSSSGALAQLFDISCLYGTPIFSGVVDAAISIWERTSGPPVSVRALIGSPSILGDHFFITNPFNATAGLSPIWDFAASQAALRSSDAAFVLASKLSGVPAPSKQDVDWLYLTAVQGDLAVEVYRTDTRSGQPPTSACTDGEKVAIKYTSVYWLTGGFKSTSDNGTLSL